MQRFLDIVLTGFALLLLLPLLAAVALILRMTGEGDVVFVQQRVGRGGRLFELYKFVTMVRGSQDIGTGTVTVKDDPRVLPVGRILRRTKLNELPQLFNVLKGDMSIVGPRPQTRRCFDAFPAVSKAEIIKVRPGLTGVGSVFFRDEEELMQASGDPARFYDAVVMPYKGALEEWYVVNQGLRTYLACIVLTAWAVVFPSSSAAWRYLGNLPAPPPELEPRRPA